MDHEANGVEGKDTGGSKFGIIAIGGKRLELFERTAIMLSVGDWDIQGPGKKIKRAIAQHWNMTNIS